MKEVLGAAGVANYCRRLLSGYWVVKVSLHVEYTTVFLYGNGTLKEVYLSAFGSY